MPRSVNLCHLWMIPPIARAGVKADGSCRFEREGSPEDGAGAFARRRTPMDAPRRLYFRRGPRSFSPSITTGSASCNAGPATLRSASHPQRRSGVSPGPLRVGDVGGDDRRGRLVPFTYDLEQQFRPTLVHGQVAELIEHKQPRGLVAFHLSSELVGRLRAGAVRVAMRSSCGSGWSVRPLWETAWWR
jgi:hypothetical protein